MILLGPNGLGLVVSLEGVVCGGAERMFVHRKIYEDRIKVDRYIDLYMFIYKEKQKILEKREGKLKNL